GLAGEPLVVDVLHRMPVAFGSFGEPLEVAHAQRQDSAHDAVKISPDRPQWSLRGHIEEAEADQGVGCGTLAALQHAKTAPGIEEQVEIDPELAGRVADRR